jgi:cytochrome c553
MKHFMLGIILSVALIGCAEKKDPTAKTAPDKLAAADVQAGKVFAEQECRGCHGLDGRGAAPGIPHLAAQRERYLLAAINAYREGTRPHAALRQLARHMSDAEVRNVVAYYAGLPPLVTAARTDAELVFPYEKGRVLAAACANCHGEEGNSKTPGTPGLAGQQPRYFANAIQEYLKGDRRIVPAHDPLFRGFTRLDIESLALYFASQTPAQRGAPPFGDPAAGEPLSAVCGGCHGFAGVSTDATTPTLASQDPQYLLNAAKSYRTTRRHAAMQSYIVGLSDRELESIVAFYAVQKSRPAEKGKTLVGELADKCNRCHGPDIDDHTLTVPKISGQDKDYLVMALRAYRDDRRESSVMHKMSLPYSDVVIESVATMYASQPAR